MTSQAFSIGVDVSLAELVIAYFGDTTAPIKEGARYLKSLRGRGKTDVLDAKGIARYIRNETNTCHAYVPLTALRQTITTLIQRRHQVLKSRTSLRMSFADTSQCAQALDALIADIDSQFKALLAAVAAGFQTARVRSIHRHTSFLQAEGDPEGRRLLYLAAVNACCHPIWKAIQAALLKKELPSTAVYCIARKILRIAFAVWNSGAPCDPNLVGKACAATQHLCLATVNMSPEETQASIHHMVPYHAVSEVMRAELFWVPYISKYKKYLYMPCVDKLFGRTIERQVESGI